MSSSAVKKITLPNNWIPRQDQMPLWIYLERGGRRAVEVAHRRWGKDDIALHFTATAAHQRVGNYWHMLPKFNQARKVVWEAVNPRTGKVRINEAFPKELRESTRNNDMVIKFKCGSQWQLVGSDNYDSLMGSPPIGIVFSEWALADPMAWAFLSPILEENGGWALFISTSRGNNHLKTLYDFGKTQDEWFSQLLPADKTPVFRPEALPGIEQQYIATYGPEMGRALFLQEYFCSFEGAVFGAYYARQLAEARQDGRITKVPYHAGHEVYTAWDLGVDDSTSIGMFQVVGREIRFIDYYEDTGYGMGHYAKILKEKPYTYGDHFMPHDADNREMGEGEVALSKKETAEKLGIKPVVVVKRPKDIMAVLQGIEAGRNIFSQCVFDEKKCARLISCLEGYRAEYDEEKKKLANRPYHDWTSHGADMFRTFAMGYRPRIAAKTVSEIMESSRATAGVWG